MHSIIFSSNCISSASFCKEASATSFKADLAQGCTQIGLVQLTKDGKFLILVLSLSPIGLRHNTICRFNLHLLTKISQSYIQPVACSFQISFISLSKFSLSSGGNKFGISPILSKLLMSSKNLSFTSQKSEIRKTPFLSFRTISRSMSRIKSSHSTVPKSLSISISQSVQLCICVASRVKV